MTAEPFSGCPHCGGILELPSAPVATVSASPAAGVWGQLGDLGFKGLVPVSLGEGATPLVPLVPDTSRDLVKFEGANPTGSWKDRLHAVNTAVARHLGHSGMALHSTGNSALAAAAYAARAGLSLRAYLRPGTPRTIQEAVRQFGAEVEMVTEAAPNLRVLLDSEGLFPATMSLPHTVACPFGLEGYKTIAYEIAAELGEAPDWVAVPVGCGDGLYAITKGFRELLAWGRITRLPRMLAAQASAAAPLVCAYEAGAETVTAVEVKPTIAISIADPIAGEHALAAVRRTGGRAMAVSDEAIRTALDRLCAGGIFAEAASAASVAAVAAARASGMITPEAQVVSVVTSSGLRWLY